MLAFRLRGDHVVSTAPNARDALDRIVAGERFDAIVCDVNMAGLSGLAPRSLD